MDVFAHALWANALFYKKYKEDKKNLFLGALFGIVPDLISFSPIFIYRFFADVDFFTLIGSRSWIALYSSNSYNYTHSLVLWAALIFIVTAIRKWKIWWPMFGGVLHILIDIPSHDGFYNTPFLFPISEYRFTHGIFWGNPYFMVINYSALAIVYISIFYFIRKSRRPKI